ncbi:MAG: hypothetical protein IPJ19_06845 [Planctomycetes bacterium]|nr:hypothetical protein [Planctomycetota bacterium]
MKTQRKLLALLALAAGALVVLLAVSLREPAGPSAAQPAREKDEPARKAEPSAEVTDAGLAELPSARLVQLPHNEASQHQDGPPVKVVGRVGDERGAALTGVDITVYDSRGEPHKPEMQRADWYECTLHERGRTLVVATREGSCTAELPFELFEYDSERHIDLVLPPRPVLRLHVRDREGNPLPRFAKGGPLRSKLVSLASVEELPADWSAAMGAAFHTEPRLGQLGWGTFEPTDVLQLLAQPPKSRTNRMRSRARELRLEDLGMLPGFDRGVRRGFDEESFMRGVSGTRAYYKHLQEVQGRIEEDEPVRHLLSALGYLDSEGGLIEGESPLRDVVGTITLAHPLPLRVGLFAAQRPLEWAEPVPLTEDLAFRIDPPSLDESYLHVWLFASDAQTGARLPRVRANLHVDSLPGMPEYWEGRDPKFSSKYAGTEPPSYLGAPAGWRFPDGEVTTDQDGRADFKAARTGWWKLTLEAAGHVPVSTWVEIDPGGESCLGFFQLAPLATSHLSVVDQSGTGVAAHFQVTPLLHAKDREGTLESWGFDSDSGGSVDLANVGRQFLLLRSADREWAMEPLLVENAQMLVDKSPLQVVPARHVLLHLPWRLPWDSTVNIAQGLTRPVYEEAFAGKTLLDLWVGDGTYTVRITQGVTALMTVKFRVEGAPQLVELAP